MAADFIIQGGVNGPDIQRQIERAIQAGVSNGTKNPIKLKVDGSNLRQISEPLGHMARSAGEFNKSLEASTARVLAFGATVGVVYNMQRAFSTMVKDAIEVEKAMKDINSVFGLTEKQLESFSNSVFKTARETGASFKDTAEAALELSRQGLSAAETTKRLADAMILARLSGLSGKDSVEALTGAINSFGKEVLTSTQIVNKFSNVASQFSVSEADFAEAIKRVGSSAEDAGVDIDHVIGLITSLKQTTQQSAGVIGNALKSIFTRLQKSDVIEELEGMGVAMRNLNGSARSADQVLQSLAQVYGGLTDKQKSYVSQISAGLFQVNQFKAAMSDLSKEYSINTQAVQVSKDATNEAIKRNEKLNETIAAQLNSIGLQGKQAGAKVGGALVQQPLAAASKLSEGFLGKDGDGIGVTIGEGIARGIGAALTGPAGAAALAILLTLVKKTTAYALDAAKALIPLNKEEQERLLIAENIDKILQHQGLSYEGIVKGANSAAEANMRLLKIVEQFQGQSFISSAQKMATAGYVQASYRATGIAGSSSIGPRTGGSPNARDTFFPNLADPLREAIDREKASGVPESSIYVDRDTRLKTSENPLGIAVANRIDEPLGVWQGVNRRLGQGNLTGGVPNFAEFSDLRTTPPVGNINFSLVESEQKALQSLFGKLRTTGMKSAESFEILSKEITDAASTMKLTTLSQDKINQKISNAGTKLATILTQRAESEAFSRKLFIGGKNKFGEGDIEPILPREMREVMSGNRSGIYSGETVSSKLNWREEVAQQNLAMAGGVSRKPDPLVASKIQQAIQEDIHESVMQSIRQTMLSGGILSKEQINHIGDQADIEARSHGAFKGLSSAQISSNDDASSLLAGLSQKYKTQRLQEAETARSSYVIGQHFTQNQGNLFGSQERDLAAIEKKLDRPLSSQEQQNIFAPSAARAAQNRRGALQSTALNASLVGSLAVGALPNSFQGGTTSAIQGGLTGLSLASLAASLPKLGALGGPVGLGIGAVAGAGLGAASYVAGKPERELSKLSEQYNNLKSKIDANTQAASNYISVQEKLNDLLASGAYKQGDLDTLNSQLSELFNNFTDPKLKQGILTANGDVKKIEAAADQSSKEGRTSLGAPAIAVEATRALKDNFSTKQFYGSSTDDVVDAAVENAKSKKEGISSLARLIASSVGPNFKSSDLTQLQTTVSGLNSSNPEGIKKALRSLNGGKETDEIVGNKASDGLKILAEAVKQIGENFKRDAAEKTRQSGVLGTDKNLRERLAESSLNQDLLGSARASNNAIRLNGARSRLQSASYGLTESAFLGAEQGLSRQEFENQLGTDRDSLKNTGLAGLNDLALNKLERNSQSQKRVSNFLGSRPNQEFSLDEVRGFIKNLDINENDFSTKSGEDTKGNLTNFRKNFSAQDIKLNDAERVRRDAFESGQKTQTEALLYRNRVAALGGADLATPPIDFTAVRGASRAGLYAQRGNDLLNSPNADNTIFRGSGSAAGKAKLRSGLESKVQKFNVTEGQGLIDMIKLLGPELASTLNTDENQKKIEGTLAIKNKTVTDSLFKSQIGGLFESGFGLGSGRGGIDRAGTGGNLYAALGESVNKGGGKVNFNELQSITEKYGAGQSEDNPFFKRLRGILQNGGDVNNKLSGVAKAQAQELLKTGNTSGLGLDKIGEELKAGATGAVDLFTKGFNEIADNFSKKLILTSNQKIDANINVTIDELKVKAGDVVGLQALISQTVKRGLEEFNRAIPLPPRANTEVAVS